MFGAALAAVLAAAVAAASASAAPASAASTGAVPARALPAVALFASGPATNALRATALPASGPATNALRATALPASGPATKALRATALPGSGPAADATAAPAGVGALGADLADAGTGEALWGRDANTERPMGSVTKVMTALVVIQAGNLGRKITVPASAVSYVASHDGSSAGLRAGDILTARQLLYAMLLPSGCDAAYVLATAYGPGRAVFVAKMNAEARQLGLAKTHFANFDGLPYPTPRATYSTPASLIMLGRAVMTLAAFRATVHRRAYHLTDRGGHHAYTWRNTNLLLGSYAGADGIKTGFTLAAGYCLLFEAQRGTSVLIGVVLHSTATQPAARFTDARRMLRWGFGILTASAALKARLSSLDP
jgi:D-alanyl-D-alanine carboxypeptidase (penicillin-binding protein 5/6)